MRTSHIYLTSFLLMSLIKYLELSTESIKTVNQDRGKLPVTVNSIY
jgi:hypothetical protein